MEDGTADPLGSAVHSHQRPRAARKAIQQVTLHVKHQADVLGQKQLLSIPASQERGEGGSQQPWQ